jgi:hypothetical protein
MLGGTVGGLVVHEDGLAVNSGEQEPPPVRRSRCPQSLAGRLFTRACWSVTRLSGLRTEPLQAMNRLPLYPHNLDRDLMTSCRLPMTFNGSIADRGMGSSSIAYQYSACRSSATGLCSGGMPTAELCG